MNTPNIISALLLSALPLGAATVTSGHMDLLGFEWNGTTIVPTAYLDTGVVIDGTTLTTKTKYDPSTITINVSTLAQLSRPAGSSWNTLGDPAGDTVWILPQTQNLDLPWPGLSTEDLDLGTQTWSGTSPFSVTLTSAVMPAGADFSLYSTGSFGTPTFYMATSNGITSADRLSVPRNTHAHYSWAFTDPGIYELTFQFAANHSTLGTLTQSATYRFDVIPEPSGACLCFVGSLFLIRRKRSSIPTRQTRARAGRENDHCERSPVPSSRKSHKSRPPRNGNTVLRQQSSRDSWQYPDELSYWFRTQFPSPIECGLRRGLRVIALRLALSGDSFLAAVASGVWPGIGPPAIPLGHGIGGCSPGIPDLEEGI